MIKELALWLTIIGLWESSPIYGDEGRYFKVARQDPRQCVAPTCDKVFVKEVNKPRTRCADGIWRRECYVGAIDFSETGGVPQQNEDFKKEFVLGRGLVRGILERRATDSNREDSVLVVHETWRAQARASPAGALYRVRDVDGPCPTEPCEHIEEERLNTLTKALIAEVDLLASAADPEKVNAGYQALKQGSILVAGTHQAVTGPAGTSKSLIASEFYLMESPAPVTGQACGGTTGARCPPGQYCEIGTPNACGSTSISGTCEVPPEICTTEHNPVCGCDGETYSNDCARRRAQVQLDHAGPCAKPAGAPTSKR
ncbi:MULTISPECIES: Kazal-type serine protease inhibitor family protein [Methylocaldum]|jgi:hypothetical protein|uniref:Kazal-type serine protease inhibitor family protein n=1 Tax=unclassified Methylocaldum TaxID=2622260 RepID=UPI00098B4BDD|nr:MULTISPECIES: DUF6748 domain-containing protein [unclassified Methylocaldum]MBP1152603.1 hypothetical protein [Methylocaldum sp. RMAD-M]MDV3241841.1 hypothetical protein [Methylocaldum sp.]